MRLFAIVDGSIDRFARAALMTPPFDLSLAGPGAARLRLFGIVDGEITTADRAQWMTPPFSLAFAAPSAARLRLFGIVDGMITADDRAQWVTPPYGLAFAPPSPYVPRYLPPAAYDGPLCVSWALGAVDTADVALFWRTVCDRGLASGTTLASLLDRRPRPLASPTTAGNLPDDINPLAFLVSGVIRGQAEVVTIRAASVGPGRLDYMAAPLVRRVVPPHTLLLVQLQMPAMIDTDPATADSLSPVVAAMPAIRDAALAPSDSFGVVAAPIWNP